jgi:hypothetical protein
MQNEAMFADSKGWVLKPKGYLGDGPGHRATPPESQAEAAPRKKLDLGIKIFAAQDIPLPESVTSPEALHPYVKVELHRELPEERSGAAIEGGGRSKDGDQKKRTATRDGNSPDFCGEWMEFRGVDGVVEELTFVR